jgi:hypothetical protein
VIDFIRYGLFRDPRMPPRMPPQAPVEMPTELLSEAPIP